MIYHPIPMNASHRIIKIFENEMNPYISTPTLSENLRVLMVMNVSDRGPIHRIRPKVMMDLE